MPIGSQIASQLLQIKAIKLSPQNPFTLASGLPSPIYCDNRVSLSYPAVRNLITTALVDSAQQFLPIDYIAGVATAGIPQGALLADRLNLPFIYIRSKAKEHGRKNKIEGDLKPQSSVLVVEDLISTGGSSLKAVEAIRQEDCEVAAVLTIFTYDLEIAQNAFKNAKCPYHALSNFSILMEEAVSQNWITAEERSILEKWQKAPTKWKQA